MIKKLFLLFILLPISLFAWKMESGTKKLNSTFSDSWTIVTLNQTYNTTPLIFALTTDEGPDVSALRIKDVNRSAFKIMQVEPDGSDGPHISMNIHYIAVEEGEHILQDGTKVIAGSLSTQKQRGKVVPIDEWESVSYLAFNSTPIVLGMIQTVENELNNIPSEPSSPWMTTGVKDVTSTDFKITLDRSETSSGSLSSNETIAYLVIDSNIQGTFLNTSCQALKYETIRSSDSIEGWNNGCYDVDYVHSYSAKPNVIATKNTRDGADGGWLRRCDISNTSVGLTVDEDMANDSDRSHTDEVAGILVFEEDFTYNSAEALECNFLAEYRFDECYWLGVGVFDVLDIVANNNAESYNNSQVDTGDAIVNYSGGFSTTGYFQAENTVAIGSEWSMSLWIKFPLDTSSHDKISLSWFGPAYSYHALGSIIGDDNDLPAILVDENDNSKIRWALYSNSFMSDYATADLPSLNGWHHFTFVQENSEILLYIDGSYENSIAETRSGDIEGYLTSFDERDKRTVGSKVDELKMWNRKLYASEIEAIYNNENAGDNFDGTSRLPVECGASIAANTWELLGIPADFRNSANSKKTVEDIFDDDMNGVFNSDWRIYKRTYSATDNGSDYVKLALDDVLEFGEGYWLGSKLNSTWSENGAIITDYNSTTSGCTASACVEIDVKSVTNDYDDGTGPYRYNMSGFVGHAPVKWADCRFVVDGTVMTASELEDADIGSKQIWQYNPSAGSANSNGYTTCDDTMGDCKLEPYNGFWVELHALSKDKTIKLLIPKE